MELAAAHLGAFPTALTPGAGTWNLETRDGVTMDGDRAEHVREAVGVLARYVDALGVRSFATLTDREADRDGRRACEPSSPPRPCPSSTSSRRGGTRARPSPTPPRSASTAATRRPQALRALVGAAPEPAAARRPQLGPPDGGPDGHRRRPSPAPRASRSTPTCSRSPARPPPATAGPSPRPTTRPRPSTARTSSTPRRGPATTSTTDRPAEAARRPRTTTGASPRPPSTATDGGVFMHCLPVRRGVVVDGDVLDGAPRDAPPAPGRVPPPRAEGDPRVGLGAGRRDGSAVRPMHCTPSIPPTVVKLGGAILADAAAVADVWAGVARARTGPSWSSTAAGRSRRHSPRGSATTPRFVAGRRVTTRPRPRIALWALRGEINARLVASAVAHGLPAAGIAGSDGPTVVVHATPAARRRRRDGRLRARRRRRARRDRPAARPPRGGLRARRLARLDGRARRPVQRQRGHRRDGARRRARRGAPAVRRRGRRRLPRPRRPGHAPRHARRRRRRARASPRAGSRTGCAPSSTPASPPSPAASRPSASARPPPSPTPPPAPPSHRMSPVLALHDALVRFPSAQHARARDRRLRRGARPRGRPRRRPPRGQRLGVARRRRRPPAARVPPRRRPAERGAPVSTRSRRRPSTARSTRAGPSTPRRRARRCCRRSST